MIRSGTAVGSAVGKRLGPDEAAVEILLYLQRFPTAVWFDPSWRPGVGLGNDSGTWRVTDVLSRPIVGQTQYLLSQGTLAIAPAEAFSPSRKRVLSFGGSHFLSGASGLAALLQGSASYSTMSLASVVVGATRVRFGFARNVATPDDRVSHYVSSADNSHGVFRVAAGGTTTSNGPSLSTGPVYQLTETYNGSDYDAWRDNVPVTLAGGGANTRAPAVLDDMTWGCQRSATVPVSFWSGLQAGLIITPGAVFSAADLAFLQPRLRRYYGYG